MQNLDGNNSRPADGLVGDSIPAAQPARLEYLDGLRGIAALGVAWFHVYTQNGSEEMRAWVPHGFQVASVWGRFGVQLFFAISGFVLAYTLLDSRRVRTAGDVGRYMARRSIRLDPVYWAVLVLYFLGNRFFAESFQAGSHWPAGPVTPETVFGDVFYFLPFVVPARTVPVVWTLALEVQLYLLFAVLVWGAECLARRTPLGVRGLQCGLLCAAAVAAAPWPIGLVPYIDFWIWPHLYNFLLGVAAFYVLTRYPGWKVFPAVALFPAIVGCGLTRSSHTAAALLSFGLLVVGSAVPPLRRVLSATPFQALGRLSYTTYLLHSLVGTVAVTALNEYLPGGPFVGLVYVAVAVVLTLAIGQIVWVAIEKPSIRWSKRLRLSGESGTALRTAILGPFWTGPTAPSGPPCKFGETKST